MAKSVFLDSFIRYHHEPPLKFDLYFSNPIYWWCARPESTSLVDYLKSKDLYETFLDDLKNKNGLLLIDFSQDPIHIKQAEKLKSREFSIYIYLKSNNSSISFHH